MPTSPAAAAHERIGAHPWLARTRLEWARLPLTHGDEEDSERAHQLLRQALTTAQHCDCPRSNEKWPSSNPER
jgi:hypothetical protein